MLLPNAPLQDGLSSPLPIAWSNWFQLLVSTVNAGGTAPAGSPAFDANGTPGSLQYDGTYLYICVATNSWRRITLTDYASYPQTPTSLTGTATAATTVQLQWVAGANNKTFTVYASATSGFTPGSNNLLARGLTSTSYTVTQPANTTLYYVVVGYNDLLASPPSAQASVSTAAAGGSPSAPAAPSGLGGSPINETTVTLTWTAGANDTTYNIYASATPGFAPSASTRISSGLSGTTATAQQASSTTLYYVVTGVNSTLESGPSNQVAIATPSPSAGNPATGALTARADTNVGAIYIDWQSSGTASDHLQIRIRNEQSVIQNQVYADNVAPVGELNVTSVVRQQIQQYNSAPSFALFDVTRNIYLYPSNGQVWTSTANF